MGETQLHIQMFCILHYESLDTKTAAPAHLICQVFLVDLYHVCVPGASIAVPLEGHLVLSQLFQHK